MDVRAHIIVTGLVQGVGYRYFILRAARKMGLTGWVKNLQTEEVEIDVEGPRGIIESLIKELPVGNAWASVRNVEVNWDRYTGKYDGFDVVF
jgi:acylphosphatase